jgi:hypothetical protein
MKTILMCLSFTPVLLLALGPGCGGREANGGDVGTTKEGGAARGTAGTGAFGHAGSGGTVGTSGTSGAGGADGTGGASGASGMDGTGGTGGVGTPATSCFMMGPSLHGRSCTSQKTDTPDYPCTRDFEPGSCPSAGLVGCCVTKPGSDEFTEAACFYDATVHTIKEACKRGDLVWSSTAP